MKAVVLVIENDETAQTIARLIASTLTMNGIRHDYDEPAVIDWPVKAQPHDFIPQEL